MRERCEVPTRADGAPTRDERQNSASETLDEELRRLEAGSGVALGQRVGAEQHRRTDDVVRIRLADAARMASQQPDLELFTELFRDRLRHEAAEPGVDAVRVLTASVGCALDDLARRPHPFPRLVREADRRALDGDGPDVVDGEIV